VSHDVIVVGLGAYGAATVYELAKRGIDVVGIDRFSPPHEMGSSHGESRGTYEAGAFGAAHHAPFSRRTVEMWRELEQEAGLDLFEQNGIAIMGFDGGPTMTGTLAAVQSSGAEYELLDAAAIRERFPAFTPEEDTLCVFQPKGGIIRVEPIIEAELRLAAERGATIRTNEPVTGWKADASGVEVTTVKGTYRAQRVIFSAGAYMAGLVPDLPVALVPERQVLGFWKPRSHPEYFTAERLPVWCCENHDLTMVFGVADIGTGVKVAVHNPGATTDPETVDRTVTDADIAFMREHVGKIHPEALGTFLRGYACLYTVTPDYDFVLDKHPEHDNVVLASCCSSQGFKYSSAFGEVLADLAVGAQPAYDLSAFSIARFSPGREIPVHFASAQAARQND
jgi:sarcosine oxidase